MQDQGRLVDIGNRCLFARAHGSGPLVVLCSGGGAEGVGNWQTIESSVSQFATVLSYDRAGIGRSDPPPAPPTAADMVTDLRALLTALALNTPAVLVGWSLSALLVQLYACKYPAAVAGLVLLDPTPDSTFAGFLKYPPAIQEQIRSATLRNSQKMGGDEAFLLEVAQMPESCEQVRCAVEEERRLPDVSLVVITAGARTEIVPGGGMAGDFLTRAHQHIAQRAPRGCHRVAARSSHRTMTSDEPELIVENIRSVLSARNNS